MYIPTVVIKHSPIVATKYIGKYLFLQNKVTIVLVNGKTKIIKNIKGGRTAVNKTNMTLIAAIIAMYAMF